MVSIIIPTYNRLKLLSYTLKSLSSDKHMGIDREVIVVDDHSTDDTWDQVLVQYPWVKLIENKGRGASAARNTGLKQAKGEYVLYLDSDDLLGPGFFKKKIEFLEQNKGCQACYGDYEYFTSDGDFTEDQVAFKNKYPLITDSDDIGRHIALYLSGKFLPANAILWRRDFLLQLGGHDELLLVNQDVDIFFKAVFAGLRIKAVEDGTTAYIRNHETDTRVGDLRGADGKWLQQLELRQRIFEKLKKTGYGGKAYARPLSYYIFSRWKMLRHSQPEIAGKYLEFAKKVHWPVELRGNVFFRLAGRILGPVAVVNLKYKLFKKD